MSALGDRIRAVVGRSSMRGGDESLRGSRQAAVQLESSNHAAAPVVQGLRGSRDLSSLGGEWRDGVCVVERRYAPTVRHGRETVGAIAERLADAAAHASWFAGGAPARPPFVFLDLETTGLSGGAGTQAFLIGCAGFDADGAFVVHQFVLATPADEERMLGRVALALQDAGALVTFNGKSFDSPLLETRYLFHRLSWVAGALPHVDVLHPARRFWGASGRGSQAGLSADCSLVALERQVLGARRSGDVPGFEIPSRYFAFVRSGDAGPLASVFEHNRLDLLTLAALASRLLHLARMGPAETTSAREALALGHVFARAGLEAQARSAFERSLALCAAPRGAHDATRLAALRALALAWRRVRQFDRAADCWSELLQVRGCPPAWAREAAEALAIHHEHRVRDLPAARAFALRGLDEALAPVVTAASWTRAVQHRLARIDRKLSVSGPGSLLS